MNEKLNSTLSGCIERLLNIIPERGLVQSVSYTDIENFSDATVRQTTFYGALTLLSLCESNSPLLIPIKDSLAAFLTHQKSSIWSWNYWNRNSCEYSTISYPDDLDDTFISLSALQTHVPCYVDEEAMVNIINLLVVNETTEGGPYYTWNVSAGIREKWNDIDIVVNSNILHFLSQLSINLPRLTEYIDGQIVTDSLRSRYYHSPIAIIYFISRSYRGNHASKLLEILDDSHPQNILEYALMISAELRLGKDSSIVAIDALFENNNIQPCALFIEQIKDSVTYYSGSSAFTLAAIIEAISLYQKAIDAAPISHATSQYELSKSLNNFLSNLPTEITLIIQSELNTIKNVPEITSLPLHFYHSINEESRSTIDPSVASMLCDASILGWAGYTIYDDVLDGDKDITYIPVANLCTREVSRIFHGLCADLSISQILNGIDTANHWESTSCKFPVSEGILFLQKELPDYGNYSILAEKSLGHALGPIILTLLSSDFKKESQAELIQIFFTHYLVARQLNDDAHDWFEDLSKGFVNPVGVLVVKKYISKYPTKHAIDLISEKETLRDIFWKEVLDETAAEIFNQIELARRTLLNVTILSEIDCLSELLVPLEISTEKAVVERDSVLKFLKIYQAP